MPELSSEQIARATDRLLHPEPGSAIEAARNYGIDLTLLIEQLRLTPAERASQMLELCQLAEELCGRATR